MKKKLIYYLFAFVIILLLNFILPRCMPGDPLNAIYGDETLLNLSPEMKESLIKKYQLDQPLYLQFFSYVRALFRGDLGDSYYHQAPVLTVILSHLPWTLILVGLSLLFASIMGYLAGLHAAWKRGTMPDQFLLSLNIILFGFPSFFIGIILLYLLAIQANLFPLQGGATPYSDFSGFSKVWDILKHAFLPGLTLFLVYFPGYFLLTRNTMILIIKEPYILTAKAKGLKEHIIKYKHAGRYALIPIVTATGVQLATRIITGALFVEVVFAYPGMGFLVFDALKNRDYPIIQGTLLFVTFMVLAINLLVDLLYIKLDPRQKYAH